MSQPCDEGVIKSKAAAAPCPKASGPWILAATILGSSMVFIDGTVVNVALPALQTNLNATVVDVQWVVEAYALFLAALLLAGGSLGDHFGRKRIYTLGVVLFVLASIWCGLAPGINQLMVARAVQGVGGALLVPGSLAIISASFGEEERGQAIGTWSGFTAITDRLPTFFLAKRGADDCQATRNQQCAAHSLHRARDHQLVDTRREAAPDRSEHKQDNAQGVDALATKMISERASRKQQGGKEERVSFYHPLYVYHGRVEISLQCGQGDVDDCAVNKNHA